MFLLGVGENLKVCSATNMIPYLSLYTQIDVRKVLTNDTPRFITRKLYKPPHFPSTMMIIKSRYHHSLDSNITTEF